MLIYDLIIVILMLCLNAVFAAYEMGLASISRARLAVLVNENKKGALDAAYMKDRIEASLAIVQLGITIVGAVAAAAGGVGMNNSLAPYLHNAWNISGTFASVLAMVFFIIPLTFVTIIFAELVPKILALNNNEWIVLKLSVFMKALSRLANPIVSVIEIIVKTTVDLATRWGIKESGDKHRGMHEFKAAVSLARASKLLGAREEKIVLSAASLSMRPVREIIIPANDISMICIEDTLSDAMLTAHFDMHTRFPISRQKDDPQTIDGYVNFKDLMSALKLNPADPSIKGIARPIKRVRDDTPISQLLEMMIQERIHIVLVLSREGGVLGMVTLEDIMEELVGEIEDEFDRLPTHIHPYGSNSWIMGGGVPMNTVAATMGLDWKYKFEGKHVPTLAEWCTQQAGNSLRGSEYIETDNLRILPRKFRRKKLFEAAVSVIKN